MKLPKYAPYALKEGFSYFIPLPKPSTKLAIKIKGLLLKAGFTFTGKKFKKGREIASFIREGALHVNFEPSVILRMLSKLCWDSYKEVKNFEPSWDNSYFVKLKNGIRLRPRINLTRRSFYRLLSQGRTPIVYDEAYITLKLSLNSRKVSALSYKTYSADNVKFLRSVGKYRLYKLEFSNRSMIESAEDIWKDVIRGRPAFLPEPGTHFFPMKLDQVELKEVFSDLDDWCLSDANLAFPPNYPSIGLPLDVL